MNKKILVSLATMGAVAALVISGTIAFFSDTETSTGNTLTAGALDLKVDSECHYNGMVCEDDEWVPEDDGAAPVGYPSAGDPCDCTWNLQDLDDRAFFNFTDVKPGDHGESTLSFHIDNDAWACVLVDGIVDADNSCTEPEGEAEDAGTLSGCDDDGELDEALTLLKVWLEYDCNNEFDDGEEIIIDNYTIGEQIDAGVIPVADSSDDSLRDEAIPANLSQDDPYCIGIEWEVPSETGNEIQTDSVGADLIFYVEQARNNPGFTCAGHFAN